MLFFGLTRKENLLRVVPSDADDVNHGWKRMDTEADDGGGALALGIDGGGTRTRACLADGCGRVVGRGEAGLANVHHAGEGEALGNLRSAIGAALSEAGGLSSDVGAVFAGMAGVTHEASREIFRGMLRECGLGHAPTGIDHDIRIALAGGLAGRPGIALIVGTGSSCYGRSADGRSWQTGGWGALLADEGSGYFLGREAMVAAARMADGRQAETGLRAAVFAWLGIDSVSALLRRIHEEGLSRTEIAAFAPGVSGLAAAGDPVARAILERGAEALAEMVAANHARLHTGERPEVVITGGVGTNDVGYRAMIEAAILGRLPGARVRRAILSPVGGAVLLALGMMGIRGEDEMLENLRAHDVG